MYERGWRRRPASDAGEPTEVTWRNLLCEQVREWSEEVVVRFIVPLAFWVMGHVKSRKPHFRFNLRFGADRLGLAWSFGLFFLIRMLMYGLSWLSLICLLALQTAIAYT
ncbi:unnamed protein product [Ostreobium quekettii]|uniref:Uncharacterized protein n=1 Tax=Ostreobium quekettii TaxID=121088 RepID=A0A8S1ISK5_9CHLO|nr:unnamed protein product [Ostreobium quekettii]